MSSLSIHSVSLHQHALALLQQGKQKDAWHLLCSILTELLGTLLSDSTRTWEEATSTRSDNTAISDPTNHSIEMMRDEASNINNVAFLEDYSVQPLLEYMLMDVEYNDIDVSSNNEFCFFASAFRFPEEIGIAQIYRIEDHINLSASVILFNMGLVCHTHGLLTGQSQSLSRAMEFYQMVLILTGMIEDLYIEDDENEVWHEEAFNYFVFLKLAVYSNLGHLHSHFGNGQKTQQCRRAIGETLTPLPLTLLYTHQQAYSVFASNSVQSDNCHETFPKGAAAA
jgi:hypothetical protein